MPRATQLRMYTIEAGRMDDFVDVWRNGVYPLRRRHGYDIDGAWVIDAENRFVWIVSYDGPDSFEEKEQAYYASPERKAMSPDPAQFIVENPTWMMTPVELP